MRADFVEEKAKILRRRCDSMASKSRAAQEKLAELEKDSAPFEDQLLEAARFIGIDLEDVGRSVTQNLDLGEEFGTAIYHGREEWLLRWLLKKLQAPKNDVPRKTPNSWILFCHLVRIVPLPNAARMLSERKFMGILQQTLNEAQKLASSGVEAKDSSAVDPGSEDKPLKASKKRKRSGELVVAASGSGSHGMQTLPTAIFAAIFYMNRFTNVTSERSEGGRTAAFSAEYMKSVIRTPAEDAAKILGSWLSLCRTSAKKTQGSGTVNMMPWLSPFIDIWDSRTVGSEDLGRFSLYCSQPLLSLLKAVNAGDAILDWKDELEQLVARNIMIPVKADKMENAESDLLQTLTRISVIQESANAPILFEVAVRSVQTHGPQRRRTNDGWLQTVFATLRAAMPSPRAQQNGKAIREMLQSAIKYKIDLGLPTLRSVTFEYCILEGSTNWDLLGAIIKLDVNVLLIPNDEKDLLQEVLTRITAASLDPTWSDLSVQVISDVLVPLMNGFAKARDLSAFIRHWHAQLVEFEKLRKEARLFSMTLFSAWEDEVLQTEFSKIMEASLTVPQIKQLLDWLSTQLVESPDAGCVILEAIAGSISQEENVDAVGLRLYDIMFDNAASEKMDGRYKWRSWRIISRTLNWIDAPFLEEIVEIWEEHALPFHSLSSRFAKGTLLEVVDGNTVELETIEAVRTTCAIWKASAKNARLENLCRKPVLGILQSLAQDIKLLPRDLRGDQELGEESCGSTLNTLFRGIGWMLWSCVQCVFVENARVLELGFEMKGDSFKDLLQTIFSIASIASIAPDEPQFNHLNPWLHNNYDAFPSIWSSILNNDEVIDNKSLRALIFDIMVSSETNKDNPLIKSPTINMFAVRCLDQLRQDVFSRKDRESIIKGWLVNTESSAEVATGAPIQSASLDPAVLSFKAKIMQRGTVYDGMEYQDLVNLADGLSSTKTQSLDASLVSFKELARRTMTHVTANLDQSRNREYALDALNHLRKKTKPKSDSKKTHKLDYALVALFDVLIEAFAAKETQLSDLDIISRSDYTSVTTSFKRCLLSMLEELLAKIKKPSKAEKQAERSLTILSTIDALAKQKIDGSELANVVNAAKSFNASLDHAYIEVDKRLHTFISTHSCSKEMKVTGSELGGDPSTVYGRQAIKDTVQALVTGKKQHQKLDLLKSILEGGVCGLLRLDSILAVRYIIMACEDSRPSSGEDNEDDSFDLSSVYSVLCSHLWKSTTIRQFSLISETMALMLRTKNRAMSQWNIDSTLGGITIICSRNAPRLRPTRAGAIFQHLCQLLNTLLTCHRLKLQGHFHIVVQAMQALLRCFFAPLSHSTSRTSKLFVPPPWLSSPKHQLNATHAVAFTRLVTLICDPSVSSVTRSKHHNLTSATDKAKRMAGQHMQFLLMLYVQLQLEMKMLPEVREKMVPALYAIFDTTTPDMRRMIGDSLDSSGRSVFGTLFRDYQRFGKWKGS